jgi:hypothetical protein
MFLQTGVMLVVRTQAFYKGGLANAGVPNDDDELTHV